MNEKQIKYYHNDYKKLLGVDQTRTASEKLLDRVIRSNEQTVQFQICENKIEKKVKIQSLKVTNKEALCKVLKNIQNNSSATKLIKPLTILKKCFNQEQFVQDKQINNNYEWNNLIAQILLIDEKIIGNFTEINMAIECEGEIFDKITEILAKEKQIKQSYKAQQQELKIEVKNESNLFNLEDLLKIVQLQSLFCKLFTDDNFSFTKTLQHFKQSYFKYFQSKLNEQMSFTPHLWAFLQKFIMKFYRLPFSKYEWIKNSLSAFFKQFNINYKQLLNKNQQLIYLQEYNKFLNNKNVTTQPNDSINLFGNGAKGGRITTIEISATDGIDKWNSKQ